MVVTYMIDAKSEPLGPCNVVDKWNGAFKYDDIVLLPCGCEIYAGDVQITQDNAWKNVIQDNHDFPFCLVCNGCKTTVAEFNSASNFQKILTWVDLFM
jgi:hypothetical protein